MRYPSWIVMSALSALAACSGPTSPYGGGGGTGGVNSGGGGPAGQVVVGNTLFRSSHNGTQNPAVDTVAAGNSVTWTWNAAGSHNVQSAGSPSFASGAIMSADGSTYSVTFNTPGTYTYDCVVHGSAMTGRIVVQ